MPRLNVIKIKITSVKSSLFIQPMSYEFWKEQDCVMSPQKSRLRFLKFCLCHWDKILKLLNNILVLHKSDYYCIVAILPKLPLKSNILSIIKCITTRKKSETRSNAVSWSPEKTMFANIRLEILSKMKEIFMSNFPIHRKTPVGDSKYHISSSLGKIRWLTEDQVPGCPRSERTNGWRNVHTNCLEKS